MRIDFFQIIKNSLPILLNFWPLFIILGVILLIKLFFPKRLYQYRRRESIMTRPELEFFSILLAIVENRFHVFPQMHLDEIFYHKIYGQNWFGAFHHINQKSVDFLICEIGTGKPLIAIELDDPSHEREDRKERDAEVERIFREAKLPLLRFRTFDRVNIATRILESLKEESNGNINKHE